MQFIAPEIIGELKGLSVYISTIGIVLGIVLWLTGWLGHRFWIVLMATAVAGIHGLHSGVGNRVPPMVSGLLLAVAAGALALALVRVVAFSAGGLAVYFAVHSLAPAAWDEPLICFLAGGLIGLLLFRFWAMILSSFAGSLLVGHFILVLGDSVGKCDAMAWAQDRAILLNWLCIGFTLVGFVIQFFIDRYRIRMERLRYDEEYQTLLKYKNNYDQRGFLSWGRRSPFRQTG